MKTRVRRVKHKTKKYRKHRKTVKMYGGNPTVITNLDSLEDPTQYSQIYIGVGTKWHNHSYSGSYGESYTIGLSQLIPSFLHRGFGKSLILLIDEFTTEELEETQRKITGLNDREYNFDIFIVNSLFDAPLATQLTKYLKKKSSLTQDNLWICNFVKFYNSSNLLEKTNRDSVASLFDSIASDPQFTNCVYSWITQTKFLIKHREIYLLGIKTIRQIVDSPKYSLLDFVG